MAPPRLDGITVFLLFAHCNGKPHLGVLHLHSCCTLGAPVSKCPHTFPELSVTEDVVKNVGFVNMNGNGVSF